MDITLESTNAMYSSLVVALALLHSDGGRLVFEMPRSLKGKKATQQAVSCTLGLGRRGFRVCFSVT